MRILALALIAFIVGFALGGWPPRSDLYAAEGEVEALKAQLKEKAYKGNPSLNGITQMLNVPKQDEPTIEPEPVETHEQGADPEMGVEEPVTGDAPPPEDSPRRNFRDHIEQAADLWGMRSDFARKGFLQNVAASEEQALRFDVVMEAMNVRLDASITHWADVLSKDAMLPTEAGIRMMNDITEALSLAYDDLDRSLPASWKRDAGDSFQIVDYIDPVVALPLADVEDKLDFE